MPRILSAGDPDDPRHTDGPDEGLRRAQIQEPDPERHAPLTHCPVCGKPLDARLLCPYCGDQDDVEEAA